MKLLGKVASVTVSLICVAFCIMATVYMENRSVVVIHHDAESNDLVFYAGEAVGTDHGTFNVLVSEIFMTDSRKSVVVKAYSGTSNYASLSGLIDLERPQTWRSFTACSRRDVREGAPCVYAPSVESDELLRDLIRKARKRKNALPDIEDVWRWENRSAAVLKQVKGGA